MSTEIARQRILSIVLAGGEGKRLLPLTLDRAKPAVPFGGHYRLIDFAISNLVNGGFRRVVVLTQYKSHSLDVHISRTWQLSTLVGDYVTPVPAQMRKGPRWFIGSADALFQNLNLVDDERPEHIIVFGADHIYRIDPAQMLSAHLDSGAGVTVAAIRVPRSEANQFGVIQRGADTRIVDFLEKPDDPPGLDDDPEQILASMGNYIFDASVLRDAVSDDADDTSSGHDIGGDLIPRLVREGVAHVYDFTHNEVPGATDHDRHYWRDVGTLDSYYDAHLDLVSPLPRFNLYNDQWPIFTAGRTVPPAKVVSDWEAGAADVSDSLLSNGVIVSGARVHQSVLSPGVHIEPGAVVEGAVLLDDVRVERGAQIRRCVIDKNVVVPAGARIGFDHEADAERFTVSQHGVVAIPKNAQLD
ncbi:MAG: glucose-1-phosphate adenylyltransferase [Acidimicrobiales bacterium]|nr:glucose-1-phosphate adenylyltransferase [Acidimicrobiales bacterium]